MLKLNIRKRGKFAFEVGLGGKNLMVTAANKKEALQAGRPLWKKKFGQLFTEQLSTPA